MKRHHSSFPRIPRDRGARRGIGFLGLVACLLVVSLYSAGSPNSAAGAGESTGAARVEIIEVGGAGTVRATAADGNGLTAYATDVEPFGLIGASWSGGGNARMRTHGSAGWGDWVTLEIDDDDAPDPNSAEATDSVPASKPTWVGRADGYELVFPPSAGHARVSLVRTDGEQRVQAAAAPNQPGIQPRSAWGARPPKVALTSAPKIQMGFVHHTVNANDYAAADVPAMLRSIQAYHMDSNGWDDIGYNFLVDRFGTAWEGRAGSLDGPVIGAHTGGFNTGSVGVAVLGDFRQATPSQASIETVSRVIGWKLGISGVDPNGTATMTSGGNDKFAEGEVVVFPAVSGHRDGKSTDCPGQRLYDQLPAIRNAAVLTAAAVTTPVGSLDLVSMAPGGIRVAGWTIDPDTASPIVVHVYVDGTFTASINADASRPDIGATYGGYGDAHGYDAALGAGAGNHTVCTYGINVGAGNHNLLGCRDVSITDNPIGSLDLVTMAPGGVRVAGWALDPNTAEPIAIHVYVDGAFSGSFLAGASRPDVAAILPSYGTPHGFDTLVGMGPGYHQVCAYTINVGPGANGLLGCRMIPTSDNPIGSLDLVAMAPGGVRVAGWTLDPNTAEPIAIHVYVDGTFAGSFLAGASRTDVAAVLPAYGAPHGFDTLVGVGPGNHQICTYAISVGPGTNSLVGCRGV